jgi:hypothetical protein
MVLLGDDKLTLSLGCHEQIEAEANYGADRLLFLQEKFEAMARGSKPSFSLVQTISRNFGNSLTSTLWRSIEILDVPAVGPASQHPKYTDATFDPNNPCRYFIRSRVYVDEFSNIGEQDVFRIVQKACTYKKGGPIAGGEVLVMNTRGEKHLFTLETFYNRYEALSLILHLKACVTLVAVSS